MKVALLLGAALAPLALAGAVQAQEQDARSAEPVRIEDVVVTGDIVFRNRTAEANPILSYDLEYFQRFEPVSVGEMLKRVPGVTFTSDVLEFDGVSMRGLPPGYTNILINGRRAPGGEDDGAFFVDRIPAELVERIEIIRSPRADQPSDGVAGALNIVLKEGAQLEGGVVRGGVLVNEDGEARGAGSVAWAGGTDNTSLWVALNYQGRRNPKEKRSERYDDDPANGGALDNIELQDDTRDGEDLSANAEFTVRFDNGRLRFNGLAVDTNRDEDETSLTFVDNGFGVFDELDETEVQAERISQQTYALGMDGEFDVGPGELDFKAGWSGFREDSSSRTDVADPGDPLELDEYVELDITDDEYEFGAAYTLGEGAFRLKFGADYLVKERDAAEVEFDISGGMVDDPDPEPGAIYRIEETRLEPFVRGTFELSPALTLDVGLRYESMDREVTSDLGTAESDASELFPSAHLTWSPTSRDQFRASWARTQRRPDYSFLAPYFADEEPGDEDGLRGNPLLESELANGLDLGYERRIGRRGVFGVNLFYREIENLIELVDTGLEVNEDGDPPAAGDDVYNLFEPRNIGDGTTWGSRSTSRPRWTSSACRRPGCSSTTPGWRARWSTPGPASSVSSATSRRTSTTSASSRTSRRGAPASAPACTAATRAMSRGSMSWSRSTTTRTSRRSWRSASATASWSASPPSTCSTRKSGRRSGSTTATPSRRSSTTAPTGTWTNSSWRASARACCTS